MEPRDKFLQELVDRFGKTRSQPNSAKVACFFELELSNVGAIVGGQARMGSLTLPRDSSLVRAPDA